MDLFIVLAVLGTAVVLAQTNHATNTFAYQGCSSLDMSCFTPPVFLNGGPLTPESCQQACQGHRFAALFPTDCRCGDDANAIKPLDESACNYPCVGDASYGMCGSICPAEGPGIANVYTKTEATSQESQILTVLPTSTLTAPISTVVSDDCSSSGQESVTQQSDGSGIPPAGPASEISMSFAGYSTSSAESAAIPSTDSSRLSGFTTSCTTETISESTSTVSTVVLQTTQTTTCEDDPASLTTSAAELTPYETTTASPPPAYTSSSQSAPDPLTYSDPYNADQAPTESPVEAPSSNDPTPGTPNYLSRSTLWSRPSNVANPPGQPPAPAQVPGSDSTHSMVPPLATLGGLAFIAAIIM